MAIPFVQPVQEDPLYWLILVRDQLNLIIQMQTDRTLNRPVVIPVPQLVRLPPAPTAPQGPVHLASSEINTSAILDRMDTPGGVSKLCRAEEEPTASVLYTRPPVPERLGTPGEDASAETSAPPTASNEDIWHCFSTKTRMKKLASNLWKKMKQSCCLKEK